MNSRLETYDPREAVEVLLQAETLEGPTGEILAAQTRAYLELDDIDTAVEYLARAEEQLGAGSELLQHLQARCEEAQASNSDESAPVEASHVFGGEDR